MTTLDIIQHKENETYSKQYIYYYNILLPLYITWNTDFDNSNIALKDIALKCTFNPEPYYIILNYKDSTAMSNSYSITHTIEEAKQQEIKNIIEIPSNYFHDTDQFLLYTNTTKNDHSIRMINNELVDSDDIENNGSNIRQVISNYVNYIYFDKNFYDMTEYKECFVKNYNQYIHKINKLKVKYNDTDPLDCISIMD
jgi:hypothetical protein